MKRLAISPYALKALRLALPSRLSCAAEPLKISGYYHMSI